MRLTDLTFCLGLAAAVAALGGCGVKPAHLWPPNGTPENAYPRVYPAPAADPRPAQQQQQNSQQESAQQP